ncbi:hypothetical protein N3930_39115, partial [Bacillus thuringiensis]|nr:hypothetical protein [Bacillus thuringiensis]
MANNKLKINIDVDTTEALKQMKEVTEAANECVAALERLEKLTFEHKGICLCESNAKITLNILS